MYVSRKINLFRSDIFIFFQFSIQLTNINNNFPQLEIFRTTTQNLLIEKIIQKGSEKNI